MAHEFMVMSAKAVVIDLWYGDLVPISNIHLLRSAVLVKLLKYVDACSQMFRYSRFLAGVIHVG